MQHLSYHDVEETSLILEYKHHKKLAFWVFLKVCQLELPLCVMSEQKKI